MKKTLLSILISLAIASPVGAQEATTNTAPTNTAPREIRGEVKTEIRDIREDVKTEIREKRTDVNTEIQKKRDELKLQIDAKRAELKAMEEQKREEFKKMVEQKREAAKQQIEIKRAEMKDRLKKIKSELKKDTVERIYDKLNEINKDRTEHFSNVMAKLDKAVERITSRTDKAGDRGLDVTTVRTEIESAKTAIAAARTAIQTQAGKTYTITVGTEETLKANAQAARKLLQDDLEKVRLIVKSAYEAVHKAATTLAQIPKVDEEESENE